MYKQWARRNCKFCEQFNRNEYFRQPTKTIANVRERKKLVIALQIIKSATNMNMSAGSIQEIDSKKGEKIYFLYRWTATATATTSKEHGIEIM